MSRRLFLGGALVSTVGSRAADATPSQSRLSTAEFVDSIGVNTHLSSAAYASRFDLVHNLLQRSGIRHLRDELRPQNNVGHWQALFSDLGVRSHMLVSPTTNSINDLLDYIKILGIDRLSAIEGQNEGDSDWFMSQTGQAGSWDKIVIDYQRAVYTALRAEYSAAQLPILSPTALDYKPEDFRKIRGAAEFCDLVAIHSYVQQAQEPETADRMAGLAWYLNEFANPFKPDAPVMATETGYHNLTHPKGTGVSEKAAAAYIPRLLLHNFTAGIRRTFLYQLLDGGADAADAEHHYGLVRHDDTPKPAFDAVSTLVASFTSIQTSGSNRHDPGSVSLVTPTSGARIACFSNGDSCSIVAVWRPVRCWDAASGTDIDVKPLRVRIVTTKPSRPTWIELGSGQTWSESVRARTAFEVPVGANAVLIRFEDID